MGWKRLRQGLQRYGSSEILWEHLAQSADDKLTWQRQAQIEFENLQKLGIRLLLFDDVDYPTNLKCLDDSPLFIYQQGLALDNVERAVAVVGSRMSTAYGREVTIRLVNQLVDGGFTIISGMARGIDTVAHQTALERGGQTIAVCGYGLDQGFPGQSQRLGQLIIDKGQLLSCFGLGVSAQAYTFAMRNSLIAGLSLGVVVTEAGLQSGSLLTAEWARKYKRPVLTVPGSIFSKGSQGPHALLKMGADLVVDAADIVEKLGQSMSSGGPINQPVISDRTAVSSLSDEQKQLLEWVEREPQSIDQLSRQSQWPTSQVSAQLMELELRGLVKQVGEEWMVERAGSRPEADSR